MKNLKKLSGILLAIAVLLACTVSAFAVSSPTTKGSITVKNAVGTEYKAYKIFDVTYDGEKYAYTIAETPTASPWLSTVQTYAATPDSGLKVDGPVTAADGSTFYNVTFEDAKFNEGLFANKLSTALASVSDSTAKTLAISGGEATVTDLDLGYYFVTTNLGSVMNLTTTNKDVVIYDKNDVPFTKTDGGVDSVELGQIVNFTIEGKVPDTTGFNGTYQYVIVDTMDTGLEYVTDSFAIQVNGVALEAEHYTLTTSGLGANEIFKVTVDVDEIQAQKNTAIVVTYKAKVVDDAVAKVSTNKATLTYSNDPSDATITTPKSDTATVYTAKIVIDKTTADGTTKLKGAKFVLKDETGKYYFINSGVVSWTTLPGDKEVSELIGTSITEVTTDENGFAEFRGLENGTYKLVETYAPDGYNLLKEEVEVTIDGAVNDEGFSTANEAVLTVKETVKNYSGTQLPSTGGIGTTIFYIVGGVLVAAAVVLLVAKKRTSENR